MNSALRGWCLTISVVRYLRPTVMIDVVAEAVRNSSALDVDTFAHVAERQAAWLHGNIVKAR